MIVLAVAAALSPISTALTPAAVSSAHLSPVSGSLHLPPYSYVGGHSATYRGYGAPHYPYQYPAYGPYPGASLAPARVAAIAPVTSTIAAQIRPEFETPKPYSFGYAANTEDGAVLNRQEDADGSGAVRGSYGYTDSTGLYRQVDYVADALGFRANVRTNEPGTANESPADVTVQADPVTVQHAPVAPARPAFLQVAPRIIPPVIPVHAERLDNGYLGGISGHSSLSHPGYHINHAFAKARHHGVASPYYHGKHY